MQTDHLGPQPACPIWSSRPWRPKMLAAPAAPFEQNFKTCLVVWTRRNARDMKGGLSQECCSIVIWNPWKTVWGLKNLSSNISEIPNCRVVFLEYLWNVGNYSMSHHFHFSRSCEMLTVLCARSASDPVALHVFNVHNHCMTGISPNRGGVEEMSQRSDLGELLEVEAHSGT